MHNMYAEGCDMLPKGSILFCFFLHSFNLLEFGVPLKGSNLSHSAFEVSFMKPQSCFEVFMDGKRSYYLQALVYT